MSDPRPRSRAAPAARRRSRSSSTWESILHRTLFAVPSSSTSQSRAIHSKSRSAKNAPSCRSWRPCRPRCSSATDYPVLLVVYLTALRRALASSTPSRRAWSSERLTIGSLRRRGGEQRRLPAPQFSCRTRHPRAGHRPGSKARPRRQRKIGVPTEVAFFSRGARANRTPQTAGIQAADRDHRQQRARARRGYERLRCAGIAARC
jgi:hypothetical protein